MAFFTLPTLRCQRCGYDWIPRIRRVTICPTCKSTLWDKPKEPKVIKSERKRAATRKRP
jgi:predicted Zn-ribbon and HTH transcriptional regulator